MNASPAVVDFSERVRKFYYHRAFLCEEMLLGNFVITSTPPALGPNDYDQLNSLYYDAFIIACAALDGLSSIWVSLEIPNTKYGNEKRFTKFLSQRKIHENIDRVCTPFLYYFFRESDIEQSFRDLIFDRWVQEKNDHAAHPVFNDPFRKELVKLYKKHGSGLIRDINQELVKFEYSALIYKYYRCSFMHAFTASQYVGSFKNGDSVSVWMQSGVPAPFINASRELAYEIKDKKTVPQLNVGLEVLTKGIRSGADYIAHRILVRGVVAIPHSKYDSISVETTQPSLNWFNRLIQCIRK